MSRHRTRHGRRHRRPHLPGPRRGRGAARARLARALAGRARQHGEQAGAAARLRVRAGAVRRRARQGPASRWRCCRCACCAPSGRASRVVRRVQPDVVLGLGGYITFPGGMMACCSASRWCCTSRTRSRAWPTRCWRGVADRVFTAFPERAARRRSGSATRCARRSLRSPTRPRASPAAAARCKLLVVGGSLGAQALNAVVPKALALHRARRSGRASRTRAAPSRSTSCAPTTPPPASRPSSRPSSTTWRSAYAEADLIVAAPARSPSPRSRPSAPQRCSCRFPSAVDDHQTTNARFLVDAGGGWLRAADRADARIAGRPAAEHRRARRCSRWRRRRAAHGRRPRRRRSRGRACEELATRHEARDQAHPFVGIGGAGMSGIAEVLLNLGYMVSGSDLADSATLRAPAPASASTTFVGHDAAQHRRRRRGGHLDRGAGRQPRGAWPRARSASRWCRAR